MRAKNVKITPATEWCLCEKRPESVILGIDRLVLVEAGRGHYIGGTFVECTIPKGASIVPRMNPEVLLVSKEAQQLGDDRDLVMLNMRDIAFWIEEPAVLS